MSQSEQVDDADSARRRAPPDARSRVAPAQLAPDNAAAAIAGAADIARRTRAGRRNMLALVAFCLLPVLASYFFYYVAPPAGRVNYGELIDPQIDWPTDAKAPTLRALSGAPFDITALRGKWVLLTIDGGACDTRCAEKLYMIRQQRLMLNKDRDRVERLWLIIDDAPVDPKIQAAYEGTQMVRVSAADLQRIIEPAARVGSPNDHLFIIDPLQHLMMRYPARPDPDGMKRDLARLLKASRIG